MVQLYQLHALLIAPCTCEFITNGGIILDSNNLSPGPRNTRE